MAACDAEGWPAPTKRCEVPPFASVVARLGERERWIAKLRQRLDWTCDSFALRPPSSAKGHTAALHWSSRLKSTDVGGIPKLTPLSVRGPQWQRIDCCFVSSALEFYVFDLESATGCMDDASLSIC